MDQAGYVKREIPADVNVGNLVRQLNYLMPISIDHDYYVDDGDRTALIVVDEVNGFCTVGCGPLAPPAPNPAIDRMIELTDKLASRFRYTGRPIILFKDCHDGPEPPYPDHCQRGTLEAETVPQLKWLDKAADLVIEKSCINGWIGSEYPQPAGVCDRCGGSYSTVLFNRLREFIIANQINNVVVVGICTDICVMEFVQSLLSARNAGLVEPLRNVVVYTEACSTYDLPVEVCHQIGLPEYGAHPAAPNQHLGLYYMQHSGAILAENILL